MSIKKYQTKVAAMPRQSVNWIVLAIAALMALAAMLLMRIPASAETNITWPYPDTEVRWSLNFAGDVVTGKIGSATTNLPVTMKVHYQNGAVLEWPMTADYDEESISFVKKGVTGVTFEEEKGVSGLWIDTRVCPTGPEAFVRRTKNSSTVQAANRTADQKFFVWNSIATYVNEIGPGMSNGMTSFTTGQLDVRMVNDPNAARCAVMWWNWTDQPNPAPLVEIIPIKAAIGSANGSSGTYVTVPLSLVDVFGDTRTLGGELCYDHSILSYYSVNPGSILTSDMVNNLGANDDGNCLKFGTYDNTNRIETDGEALYFQFLIVGQGGQQTNLTLQNMEVGPNLAVENTAGMFEVAGLRISGTVMSFTGKPDWETHFRHYAPNETVMYSVMRSGDFEIINAVQGEHRFEFWNWDPTADAASISVNDLSQTFLCYLGKLASEHCPLIALDANQDNELSMTDVLYVGSFILGIDEGSASYVGKHRYSPNPLGVSMTVDVSGLEVISAVSGDADGSRFETMARAASTPQVEFEQVGNELVVTLNTDHQFHAAVFKLGGATVQTAQVDNADVRWNGNSILYLGSKGTNTITVKALVEGTVNSASVETSDPIVVDDEMPVLQLELYMPLMMMQAPTDLSTPPDCIPHNGSACQ